MKPAIRTIFAILTISLLIHFCGNFSPDKSFLQQLANIEYQIDDSAVRLVDGKAVTDIVPNTASKLKVRLSEWLILGDLNCDQYSDAAVILITETGGSGSFYYLVPVINKNEQPMALSSYFLGDRISMVSLDIADREISVVYLDRKQNQPMSETPRTEIKKRFRLENNQLAGRLY